MNSSRDHSAHRFRTLQNLHEITGSGMHMREALTAGLQILKDRYSMRSGAVMLRDGDSDIFRIAASVSIDPAVRNVTYRENEGLIGHCAASGKTLIIPQVTREPAFLNKLKTLPSRGARDQSLFLIPMKKNYRVIGVLVISLAYRSDRDMDAAEKFLYLAANALTHPVSLHLAIEKEHLELDRENRQLKQQLQEEHRFEKIIGSSAEMRDVYRQVDQVSQAGTPVLIRGESGTGKELIAQAIHYNSPRRDSAFVRVNCAAVPESLIESEFFGYEKGAYTGAVSRRKGRFELADGGTLFLDEVGELSPMTQVKLLRALQEQEFERLGGTETVSVDVRIIAATNTDLEEGISRGTFREDLYYRLNVFSIFLPPLRERKSDILLLADHFSLKYGRLHKKAVRRMSTPAIDMLIRYHWPGNVRELENCMERAVLLCDDNVIHSHHLPPSLQTAESSGTTAGAALRTSVETYEKELIQDALKSCRGNRRQTARLLDSSERIINYKIEKYGIDVGKFK